MSKFDMKGSILMEAYTNADYAGLGQSLVGGQPSTSYYCIYVLGWKLNCLEDQ